MDPSSLEEKQHLDKVRAEQEQQDAEAPEQSSQTPPEEKPKKVEIDADELERLRAAAAAAPNASEDGSPASPGSGSPSAEEDPYQEYRSLSDEELEERLDEADPAEKARIRKYMKVLDREMEEVDAFQAKYATQLSDQTVMDDVNAFYRLAQAQGKTFAQAARFAEQRALQLGILKDPDAKQEEGKKDPPAPKKTLTEQTQEGPIHIGAYPGEPRENLKSVVTSSNLETMMFEDPVAWERSYAELINSGQREAYLRGEMGLS